jgi:hypothetical protein
MRQRDRWNGPRNIGLSVTVSARALNVASLNSLTGFDHHDGTRPPAHGYESATTVLSDDNIDRRGRADVVTRSRVHRRLIQRESVQRNDFFPGQLIGGAPAHTRQHIALLDEPATLRPNYRSCANWDHGRRSRSYSEQRLGYGCGANAANITRRWPARSPSSYGGRMRRATDCVLAYAVPPAAGKARRCSGQAGLVIMSASIHSRLPNRSNVFRLARGFCWLLLQSPQGHTAYIRMSPAVIQRGMLSAQAA